MQIELRFRISSESLPVLRRYPLLRRYTSSMSPVKNINTYYDTPDFALRDQGLVLHIAQFGGKYTQVLQGMEDANDSLNVAFSHRWESPVPDAELDISLLEKWLAHEHRFRRRHPNRSRLSALLPNIAPIFNLNFGRTVWQLAIDGKCTAELVLDHGDVKWGDARQPIAELVLTHQTGSHQAFYEFALSLQQGLQLHPICRSAVRCGYALRDMSAPCIVSAEPPALCDDADAVQGLQIIIGNCLRQIHGNAAGVVYSENAENVHQMRVGLRRLRSALQIFAPLFACPTEIMGGLTWLAAELGGARDWDVLDGITLPALANRLPNLTDMLVLQTQVHREAIRKHRNAALAVDSARSARLWVLLRCWLSDLHESHDERVGPSESTMAVSMPLRHFAERHIRRIHKKAKRRCEDVQIAVPESRHRVRIASKKLRYATEFFAPYYPNKAVTRFIGKLSKLQDTLGVSNDAAVATRLLMSLAKKRPELTEVCALVRGYQAALDDNRMDVLGKRIRRFAVLKKMRLREVRR